MRALGDLAIPRPRRQKKQDILPEDDTEKPEDDTDCKGDGKCKGQRQGKE